MRTVKKDYILHVRVPEDVYNYILHLSGSRGWLKSAVVLDMIESYMRADRVFSELGSFYDSKADSDNQL